MESKISVKAYNNKSKLKTQKKYPVKPKSGKITVKANKEENANIVENNVFNEHNPNNLESLFDLESGPKREIHKFELTPIDKTDFKGGLVKVKLKNKKKSYLGFYEKYRKPYTLRKHKNILKRKKTPEILKKPQKRDLEFVLIPKGTIIWRSQPVSCSNIKPRYDHETGKNGIYYALKEFIPLGMILEYNKTINLCKYELKTDVYASLGKYSFRHLNPIRHSDEDYNYQNPKIKLLSEENVSHFDAAVLPLDPSKNYIHKLFRMNDVDYGAELFISDSREIKKMKSEKVTVKEATKRLEKYLSENSIEYKKIYKK